MNERERWRNVFTWAILLVALGLPRAAALDRLVTPDEVTWLSASSNFYLALTQNDFAHTYQLEHPGVTTLWAGAAGFLSRFPDYGVKAQGPILITEQEPGPVLRSLGHEPLELIRAGRAFIVLGVVIVLAAAFWCAVALVGFWSAVIGFLLIAFDPFHIAHSRLLHQDGMASSFTLLTLLSFLCYLYRGRQWRYLLLSGSAAGLAWLTKSPMLFLIPCAGLLLLIELEKRRRAAGRLDKESVQWAAQTLIVWGAAGLVVFVLLWPVMWVDPIYTLRRVLGAMIGYAVRGHTEAPLFFNGKIYTGDPGLSFYPITYLWRTTPIVLMGLLFAGISLIIPKTPGMTATRRQPIVALFLFAVLFTVFMSLGAKKFDRYLLPIYPPLDLVAGVGWVTAARWIRQRWPQGRASVSSPALLLVASLGQAACALSGYPYYLSYYDPLLGGTPRAPEVMMVGWGEGLDQAARFLKRPGDDSPQVMLGLWTGTFSYFYDGPIQWSDFAPGETTIKDWLNSDYGIVYINQWQRGRLPQELIDYLSKKEPAFVVRLQGLDYAYVYDLDKIPPPDYLFVGQDGAIEMDNLGH
jgi:hypothetical protein